MLESGTAGQVKVECERVGQPDRSRWSVREWDSQTGMLKQRGICYSNNSVYCCSHNCQLVGSFIVDRLNYLSFICFSMCVEVAGYS